MDSALSMIGLALRAGRLEAGEDPAGEVCRGKRCRLLLTARDASENTLRRAERFAREGACLRAALPCTKAELGAALGRENCAMAAVTDLGFALAIAEKLGEGYEETAEKLRLKARRALQRKEARASRRKRETPVSYNRKDRKN